MSVKWIKITTNMFDDEKMKLIESMPDKDAILIIWVKLLIQAGKTNASGYLYLNENIPYTDEMLATIFNRPIGTVRMALDVFLKFGMIEMDNRNYISISNWEKHQNVEGMEKIREQTRRRVAEHREKQKLLGNDTCNVTATQSNALDIDKELDIEKDKIPYSDIVCYLNLKAATKYKPSTAKTKELIRARWNDEGFRLEDFKAVIDKKTEQWLGTNDEQYLRPITLFGTKFESYLNQKSSTTPLRRNKAEQVTDKVRMMLDKYGGQNE